MAAGETMHEKLRQFLLDFFRRIYLLGRKKAKDYRDVKNIAFFLSNSTNYCRPVLIQL
jgi:hypothetical protein